MRAFSEQGIEAIAQKSPCRPILLEFGELQVCLQSLNLSALASLDQMSHVRHFSAHRVSFAQLRLTFSPHLYEDVWRARDVNWMRRRQGGTSRIPWGRDVTSFVGLDVKSCGWYAEFVAWVEVGGGLGVNGLKKNRGYESAPLFCLTIFAKGGYS